MIAKKDLEHGEYYVGDCRNATVARWNAKTEMFFYNRKKFGSEFTETIFHPDDDKGYDVFIPSAKCQPTKVIELYA